MSQLERVHKFTMIAKHMFGIGSARDDLNELCLLSEEAGDDLHEHMTIRVGGNYYQSKAILEALDDLRMKAMLNSLTSSDTLLVVMLQDSGAMEAYGVLLQNK